MTRYFGSFGFTYMLYTFVTKNLSLLRASLCNMHQNHMHSSQAPREFSSLFARTAHGGNFSSPTFSMAMMPRLTRPHLHDKGIRSAAIGITQIPIGVASQNDVVVSIQRKSTSTVTKKETVVSKQNVLVKQIGKLHVTVFHPLTWKFIFGAAACLKDLLHCGRAIG